MKKPSKKRVVWVVWNAHYDWSCNAVFKNRAHALSTAREWNCSDHNPKEYTIKKFVEA